MAPLTRTSASPVSSSPPSFCSPSLSCPDRLLAWRGWRRSPMEALVNFHTHKNKKKKENYSKGRKCRDLTIFLLVSFHPLLSSAVLYTSSFSPSHITIFLFCVNSRGFFLSTCRGARLFLMAGSWGKAVQGRERGREISVLMIFVRGWAFSFFFFY